MKLKAVITLEFEAADYLKAKAREEEINRFLAPLRADFDRVEMKVTERRPRLAKRAAAPEAVFQLGEAKT